MAYALRSRIDKWDIIKLQSYISQSDDSQSMVPGSVVGVSKNSQKCKTQTYWIRNSRGRLRNLFYQALQVILMNMKI